MANVLNYKSQPDNTGDNVVNYTGTVNLTGTLNGYPSTHLDNVLESTVVTLYNTNTAINISGVALISGGTGLANMTLAAPTVGCHARIRLYALTSGSVVIKTPSGVTFDGTNNTATFGAANQEIVLGYETAVRWVIIENDGAVFSST